MPSISKQLKIADEDIALQTIEQLVLRDMKQQYQRLLKEYSCLFGKVLTETLKKQFGQLLVHPSQLGLF